MNIDSWWVGCQRSSEMLVKFTMLITKSWLLGCLKSLEMSVKFSWVDCQKLGDGVFEISDARDASGGILQ